MAMRIPLVYQVGKFAVVGVSITALNYGMFFVLYRFFHVYYLAASVVGYVTGLVVGFFLNRSWTFQTVAGRKHRQFVGYVFVSLLSLVASALFLQYLVGVFRMNPLIANIGAIALSAITNFLGYKYFVFQRSQTSQPH